MFRASVYECVLRMYERIHSERERRRALVSRFGLKQFGKITRRECIIAFHRRTKYIQIRLNDRKHTRKLALTLAFAHTHTQSVTREEERERKAKMSKKK